MGPAGQIPFLEQLYNHVALPRNVPGKEDANLRRIEDALLTRVLDALAKLMPHVSPAHLQHVKGLKDTLLACRTLNIDGTIGKSALARELRGLDPEKMLVLHAAPQNCALLVYQHVLASGDICVVFEAFETSATADKVLESRSALQWDFPGWAIAMPLATFNEESFQEGLAAFMEQASTERITRFAAVTWKASAKIPEIRDTSDPALISGLLMTILEANGAEFTVPRVRKRVRDTVTFDNARKPWRRSAFYLVLRVAMQRYLYAQLGAEVGRHYYKTIMCLVLVQLLEDVLKRIPLEAALFLRQKLGRRLAKLESDAHNAGRLAKDTYYSMLESLKYVCNFEATLATTGGYLKKVWRNYRQRSERYIPILHRHAGSHELRLRMNNSGRTLREVPSQHASHSRSQQRAPAQLLELYEQSVGGVKPYTKALARHILISQYHEDVIVPAKLLVHSEGLGSIELSGVIREYVQKISVADVEYPNQFSQMLLHLMELWVLMDKDAVACYPLLKDYHPGFDADILDPIQTPTLCEMERAQDVRAYLAARYRSRTNMETKTIFDDPADDCFAVQYYNTEGNDTKGNYPEGNQDKLSQIREEIEDDADCAYAAKEAEWEEKSKIHEEMISRRNEKECVYDTVTSWDGTTEQWHRKPCEWHNLHHEAKNMKIQIFEHPLPKFEPATKAALFELQCPKIFAAYRDATWLILSTLCCQKPADSLDRISLIREYSQLRPYINDTKCQVALGSYKKAHLESHYAIWGFPIRLEEVLRTCGLKPRYYDSIGNAWTGGYIKASLWHHFPLKLPPDSSFLSLGLVYATWPTSNEVQANQARCPQGLSVHEFTAWQGLLVGTHSRWLDILREMGSTNLNFSSLSTWVLVLRLVLQHGPGSTDGQPYTYPHSALLDEKLCEKLLQQVRYRVEAIHRNWREPVQMEILLTILLKIVSLAPSIAIQDSGLELLQRARSVTDNWRTELQSIVTEDSKVLQSTIWACLLCKRTLHTYQYILSDPGSLRNYIDASISLQYNLTGTLDSMSYNLQNAIVSDILFAYDNRDHLEQAILTNPQTLIDAIGSLWQIPVDYKLVASGLELVPDTWWILLTVESTTQQHSYPVHYNYVNGTMLVDGQEMSSLPLAYRTHPTFRHIFGTRNPNVFPSLLHGMEFTLADAMRNDYRVHLGFLRGRLIIRAARGEQLLEFVPREVFGTVQGGLDVPKPLIDDCYHWLDVYKGHVEIRQKDCWASRPGNWWILWHSPGVYQAVRRRGEPGETTLLDPASGLAQSIIQVFSDFEHPSQIMMFASRDGKVTAELKRMELSFYINDAGLLQSGRLGAVIMQNQDAGTWYGLRSKIVVQSVANRRQKSILIPLGPIWVTKDQFHVSVGIEMVEPIYLMYNVNEVLGRIECSPEPRLLYMKALLHAYTSHPIFDPLTNRTGGEEALYLLQTGSYQPWRPFSDVEVGTLKRIAELSPKRGYYPEESKCMETVLWNPEYTIHMQDDRYHAAVAKIMRRSSDLSKFYQDRPFQELVELPVYDAHLVARAIQRSHGTRQKDDTAYCARDTRNPSLGRLNVFVVSKLLLEWRPRFSADKTLLSLLHNAPVVGGYDKLYRKYLLSDHLAVDIRAEWGALAQKSLQCGRQDRYSLMFLLGTMAFSDDANVELLRVLISFAMLPEIRDIQAPEHPAYFHFRADGAPPPSYLISLMEKARMAFCESGFKKRSQLIKAESLHGPNVERSCEALARSIGEQWPTSEIDVQKLVAIDPTYLDVDRALADLKHEWVRFTQNHALSLYLERVQEALWRFAAQGLDTTSTTSDANANAEAEQSSLSLYPTRVRDDDDVSLSTLLGHDIAGPTVPKMASLHVTATRSYGGDLTARSGNITHHHVNTYEITSLHPSSKVSLGPHFARPVQSPEIERLRHIVSNFKNPDSFVQSRYSKELEISIDALQKHISNRKDAAHIAYPRIRTEEILPAKDYTTAAAGHIRHTIQANYSQAKWLQMVDLWPKMTTVELLTELRVTSGTTFGRGTKEALVGLGLAVSKLQHLLRIQDAQKRRREQQERDEWANVGHTNWDPLTYPDWLLLEIDGDILLREEQVQVALATISPESGTNSVLQLLMGKGKTSCILPMVAALLANQLDLARVVVPRALLLQSGQVMQAKLGGLVNRELMHLPFYRKTPTTHSLMYLYGKMHTQLRDRSGVLIALPEHVLSFKLSGLQQLCDEHLEEASTMIKIQSWLDKYARDILDECDVSLAIRTQLIYPSGSQTTVDGHPMRWQVIQALLHLVKDFLSAVQSRYRRSIEIVRRGIDSFPLIYFLRKDAEDYLIELLVKIICKGQTPSILPCAEYPVFIKRDIEDYISSPSVNGQVSSRVTDYFRDKQPLMRTVNLLRGLFVHRILIATLKKRWNVQYGLHPTRAPIAVPYLAKGVPSPAAEWGHPDVAIILTCLSFYYQGLSVPQFKQAFAHLVKTDEPSVEYEKWFPKGIDIPRELDDYVAINAEDMRQLIDLYHFVRSSASLVDFYLNNFVFPKYAKTFRLKLQASCWNLFPSISVHGQVACRVTGFSGTNDSRHQLPLLIQQRDLSQLAHTNAEVPYYLLAYRNQSYVRMAHIDNGLRWTELDLINHLAKPFRYTHHAPRIRILIDSGAQILEHSNRDFAKAWLEADHDAAAAVYFDDDHRVWVLYRTGGNIPLLASPFVDNLDRCVVYLDESHCRGTDLKFPPHARAALTLGQHLTKDSLVQAAMRLRLLGETQSVMFFSPPEVHQGILDRLPANTNEFYKPTSADVLRWVFGQTCDTIEQLEPSYFAQTSQYLQQEQARLEYPEYLQDSLSRDAFLAAVRTKESLSLKQLYEPKRQRRATGSIEAIAWRPSLLVIATELQRRKRHFQDRGSAVHASALEEVEIEQEREAEREVETEVENVREVQQALLFDASKIRKLHEDIEHFATYGHLVAGSDAYKPMFSVLGRTSLGLKHTVNSSMRSGLWISAQFSRIIEIYEPNDNYVRSCHWVLWSSIGQQALMVSPEEANELLALLRHKGSSDGEGSVHLIVYSAPVTRRMLHFNQLDYYATPPLAANFKAPVWLRVELGIFSGRLYLEWDEYYELLGYLGLDKELSQDQEKQAFAKKPLTFLHEWLALRRKGQDFEHTPMGFVTTGKPLTENHPFFRSLAFEVDPILRPQVARHTSGHPDADPEDEVDGDDDEEDFVPAVEHVDDSEGEDDRLESDVDEDEDFIDALEDAG
ncbi:hypothetical protein EJ02DRAFT_423478 [Clathrospora elynae]|uniref:ubiquitinyl hydrolase 1 n=1 Tax=Clathrospora elynae TaxID=706981 RepID=A0A6A5SMJ9_9PLEO|nr:hypothetical protein EJ02DRAFT_423478 [Clathrospora elynae]